MAIIQLVTLVTLWLTAVSSLDVIVNTQYGDVRGQAVLVDNTIEEKIIHDFRGIPFAKDTSGPRRFANPSPVDPWSPTVLNATVFGHVCPQKSPWFTRTEMSEDCLNLDITSPDVNGGPYPVMFWVHGGAYQRGASREFPGHLLSMFDAVVVCVNYRLGKLGFAYTGNNACPGNAGLWDQKMGLEFVINNIRNFGGDPTRITVFGESAGSTSASLLMLSPQTKDMFQQAILESGSATNYWTINTPESHPEKYIYQVAKRLDCSRTTDEEMMECLRSVEWQDIIDTMAIVCTKGHTCLGMAPVVDGEGGFLPKTPRELRQDGDIMKGPIMAGTTGDEGWKFVQILQGIIGRRFWDLLTDIMKVSCIGRYDLSTLHAARNAIRNHYVPSNSPDDRNTYRTAVSQMLSDAAFGLPWETEMINQQSINSVYGFVFNYSTDPSSRVGHTGELPYVWGNPMLKYNRGVLEHIADHTVYTKEDIKYSLFVQKLFTNFAKYGNPTPQPVDDPFGEQITWPKFDTGSNLTLRFGHSDTEVTNNYHSQDYRFWREYLPRLLRKDNDSDVSNEADEEPWVCMFSFTEVINFVFDMPSWIIRIFDH